jgi:hypothetical protein
MTEQQIIEQLLQESPNFIGKTSFSIIEETLTDHPLHQAIKKLDLNAQVRIFAAINDYF